ncbi:DUF362 domain-containing protein, partial [Candidatus Latescibacterota bacterium]
RSTPQALDNFGYRPLMEEYDVGEIDLNHISHEKSFEIVTSKQSTQMVEYVDMQSLADTIISVPVAKTHDCAMVTLSVKNMMGCLRRVHRPRMHGLRVGGVTTRIGEWFWNTIEGHPLVVKSFSGVVFGVLKFLRSHDNGAPGHRSPGLLRQVAAMAENIRRMGKRLMPDIAVIDAFEAMEGNGPGSAGTPVDMRIAVAGTDPVACDTVMAYLMGFDPMDVGYLTLLGESGLGTADLADIEILGEDVESLRHAFQPHKNFPVQKRWREAWD